MNGTSFFDALKLFEADRETRAIMNRREGDRRGEDARPRSRRATMVKSPADMGATVQKVMGS